MKKSLRYIVVAAVMISCAALFAGCSKKEETKESQTETIVETETETETEMELVQVAADQNVVNIMLVGQDRRQNDSERQRSDSMILLTLNRSAQTLDMTSFMRDTYVEIPGWGGNRLNAAYVFGSIDLMNETFLNNFGVKIDGVVEVDFYDFVEIIDEIGGVDIEIKEEEVSAVNSGISEVAKHLGEDVRKHQIAGAGLQHLDGLQALSYCRLRKVGNNDFERTERQRRVVQEVFKQAKNMNTMQMLSLLDKTFELLNTNLTDDDLLNLMVEIMGMGVAEFETHNIPEDAGYSSQSVDGMAVLVPDLEACKGLVQEIIGETEAVLETNE